CTKATAITDIGLVTSEEFGEAYPSSEMLGSMCMLQELGCQFDIIDSEADFSNYKLLILPDKIPVSESLANRLKNYVAVGGKIIATYFSGLNPEKTNFALSSLGVELSDNLLHKDDSLPARGIITGFNNHVDYIVPEGIIGDGLYKTEYVMYAKAIEVRAVETADILVSVKKPYFDRDHERFCGHLQTPSSGETCYPGIIKNNECIYFAHPIFSIYNKRGPLWCKVLFNNALKLLLDKPVLFHDGPSTVVVTLNEQKNEKRWIIHLLHYIPQKKCEELETIEDVIPLDSVNLSVRADKDFTNVACVPEGESLNFRYEDGRIHFTVPRVEGHQMISLEYV
ncbi:MAG: beta-galactosidase trimerization domain-containing protein, partial [Bacteroidia bacterium]|nr:beta-galactosidase trimerization domain-containing protein [Bacteroidia bacterium]